MTEAFFTLLPDDSVQPSDWCRGPWTPDAMHGSPPAALLGRAIERASPRPDALVVRASFELLGPVTLIEPHGTGLCTTRIYDEGGPMGASQTLFIAPRS